MSQYAKYPVSGGGGGTVTSVTASSPLSSSGGSTPNISLTGVVPIANGGTNASSASVALTNLGAANNTLSNLVSPVNVNQNINILAGTAGAPSLAVQGSLTTGLFSSASNSISVTTSGAELLKLSGTTVSILSTGVLNINGLTASRALATDGSKNVVSALTTSTELGYLNGVQSSLANSEVGLGNSGTALTINFNNGPAQAFTLTGNVTLTLSNVQAGGSYLIRIMTGAGGFTVTWPAAVKWPSGTTPTITATASKVDLVNLYSDGTTFYGSIVQNY